MLRFKSFSSESCHDDLSALERQINEWLAEVQPHIQHMAQSAFGQHLVLSFVYDDAHRLVATAERATAVPGVFEDELQDTDLDPLEVTLLPDAELPY